MTSMNTLTIELIGLLFATFLGAGVVKGVTGMGLPTVAIGLLGVVMSPLSAAGTIPMKLTWHCNNGWSGYFTGKNSIHGGDR